MVNITWNIKICEFKTYKKLHKRPNGANANAKWRRKTAKIEMKQDDLFEKWEQPSKQ